MNGKKRKRLRDLFFERQNGKCCYCECDTHMDVTKPFSDNFATIEHLKRKFDGGNDTLDNLAMACYSCNNGRGDKDWLTYKSMKLGEI